MNMLDMFACARAVLVSTVSKAIGLRFKKDHVAMGNVLDNTSSQSI